MADSLEGALSRTEQDQPSVRSFLSEGEEVDIAAAITRLQMQEVAYQATLCALSKSLQPSLVDFLR